MSSINVTGDIVSVYGLKEERVKRMIVAGLRTVGSYTLHPHSASIVVGVGPSPDILEPKPYHDIKLLIKIGVPYTKYNVIIS